VAELNESGEWWLPERPESKVRGTLTFTPDDGGTLTLYGALCTLLDDTDATRDGDTTTLEVTADVLERLGTYPRIHGQAGAHAFTLEDCFRTGGNLLPSPVGPPEVIHVDQVLKGVLFEEGEPLEANGITFGVAHLEHWILESGIQAEVEMPSDGGRPQDRRYRLQGAQLPERAVTLEDGREMHLIHRLGLGGDEIMSRSIEQHFRVRVDMPQLEAMSEVLRSAADLANLLTIATGRPIAFRFVNFWHPEATDPEPIELIARWTIRTRSPRNRPLLTSSTSRSAIWEPSTVSPAG
jgi:hypothetical protein